jgi:hypothetical protein
MLGEQFAELKGKITGQKVMDSEGPCIEASVSVSGTMKGVAGGKGEPEMISYTGEGIGRAGPTGNVAWRGSVFFRKSSGDKLAFLNNMVGVFEYESKPDGTSKGKIWEWK